MEYSVLFNESTDCFEMVYWERLENKKRVAVDRTELKARTREAAEVEAAIADVLAAI